MRLTASSRNVVDTGKILSMLTTDANTVYFLFIYGIYGLNAPLTLVIALTLIILQIGWVGFIGPILIFLSLFLQGYLSAKNAQYKNEGLIYSDKRQKYLKEFFSGIRILKYYAWEEIVESRINDVRKNEASMIFKMLNIRSILDSVFEITPILISVLVFSLYVALGNELDATTTFTVVSLFMIFSLPIRSLSFSFALLAAAKVSFKRINFFMEAEEMEDNVYDKTLKTKLGEINLKYCNFKWNSDKSKDYI